MSQILEFFVHMIQNELEVSVSVVILLCSSLYGLWKKLNAEIYCRTVNYAALGHKIKDKFLGFPVSTAEFQALDELNFTNTSDLQKLRTYHQQQNYFLEIELKNAGIGTIRMKDIGKNPVRIVLKQAAEIHRAEVIDKSYDVSRPKIRVKKTSSEDDIVEGCGADGDPTICIHLQDDLTSGQFMRIGIIYSPDTDKSNQVTKFRCSSDKVRIVQEVDMDYGFIFVSALISVVILGLVFLELRDPFIFSMFIIAFIIWLIPGWTRRAKRSIPVELTAQFIKQFRS